MHTSASAYSFALFDASGNEIAPISGTTSGEKSPSSSFFEPFGFGKGFTGFIRGIEIKNEAEDLTA